MVMAVKWHRSVLFLLYIGKIFAAMYLISGKMQAFSNRIHALPTRNSLDAVFSRQY